MPYISDSKSLFSLQSPLREVGSPYACPRALHPNTRLLSYSGQGWLWEIGGTGHVLTQSKWKDDPCWVSLCKPRCKSLPANCKQLEPTWALGLEAL